METSEVSVRGILISHEFLLHKRMTQRTALFFSRSHEISFSFRRWVGGGGGGAGWRSSILDSGID